VQKEGARLRVWYIRTLHETFRLYVDENDTVRCEHEVRFLGLRVLTLHYRIASAAVSSEVERGNLRPGDGDVARA